MNIYNKQYLTQKAYPINDEFMQSLKTQWITGDTKQFRPYDFLHVAPEWFKSTQLNDITGWDEFPYTDVIVGCTHYIESLIMKFGWDGFQILPGEYAYYGLMGKHGTLPGELKPNIPLIISIPCYTFADLRPDWLDILVECEQKNIDIHIDFAWITIAKDIKINLTHPNIKSFAMSLSKYCLQWNRIGIRWSRQRTMDSVTLFNHYYGEVNTPLLACGTFMVSNIPRDYGWNTYSDQHYEICRQLDLKPTNIVNLVMSQDNKPLGIGRMIQGMQNV